MKPSFNQLVFSTVLAGAIVFGIVYSKAARNDASAASGKTSADEPRIEKRPDVRWPYPMLPPSL